jgi:hypothetical protein
MTDDLLDRLAGDLQPRLLRRVGCRLALALIVGGAVSTIGVLLFLGPRRDMATATASPMFWVKLAYPLALAAIGAACVERLARPSGEAGRRVGWLAAPIALMAVAAMIQWMQSPAVARPSLLMGTSAMVCPWLILTTAAPLFVAMIWALRGLAPTRLGAAGAMAGLTAGAAGATAYAVHCGEMGGAFVLTWYSLGMIIPAALGWLLGDRLLRWR